MRDNYLVFGQPLIEEAEIEEVVDSLRSAWLGTGPKVAAFEKAVAEYKGASHAVAVNSCTAGLHLSCVAAGLKPGDEVIVPAMTFCASVNAIVHAGATPVLADVDPLTFNVDPKDVERRVTGRTRAIMPVHFAGRACDMDALCKIANQNNLILIEDCAHGIETQFKGRSAGTFSQFGVLSFYSTKNVVTGEGGMVLTNDAEAAARIRMLALHGMSQDAWKRFSDAGYKHYDVVEIGFKYNMMDLQAAIGLHQIRRVNSYAARRRQVWDMYDKGLGDLPLKLPAPSEPHTLHALHLYTILVDAERCGVTRDDLISSLHRQNIGTGVHYRSIPEHPVYRRLFGWRPEQFPIAAAIGRTTCSIPLSAKLSDDDVNDVIAAIRRVVAK